MKWKNRSKIQAVLIKTVDKHLWLICRLSYGMNHINKSIVHRTIYLSYTKCYHWTPRKLSDMHFRLLHDNNIARL